MSEVILRRNQKKISLDQRHIEVPGKVTSKRGLSDTIATVNRDDYAWKPSHDPCQGLPDLRIAWKNGGQDGAYQTKLTGRERTARQCRRWASVLSESLAV